MSKLLKIIIGLISSVLFIVIAATMSFYLKTQSVTYVDEFGETRLENHPSAKFVGGKAFGWFVVQEPIQSAVIINVFSESGNLQGRYELLLPESQRSSFTTSDITFFNNDTFTLSDGNTVNSRLLSR
ncbi:hypothetical protein [Vibrio jasicida]|uniref:hypothetical protein n=1 Tax=Vibrio jasicida TaxID=766224 RepID=UPI0005777B7E|nr:hypothetical protein [Vibrio jasicida]